MMDAMRGVMKDTADRLGESGNGQIAAGGQVCNPGIRVTGGMEYFVEATYVGVAGQVTASMQGNLNRPVPQSLQDECNIIWRNTSWSADRRTQAIKDILLEYVNKKTVNLSQADKDSMVDDLLKKWAELKDPSVPPKAEAVAPPPPSPPNDSP
jgi:hypothetical protein